jgi:hypothetical protein
MVPMQSPSMPDEFLPFTMMDVTKFIPRPPIYAAIQVRSVDEHVHHCLPRFLQGTTGVVHLIASFVGYGYKWTRVVGNWRSAYANRHKDLYFLFSVLSQRLPLPTSMGALRCFQPVPPRHREYIDLGSRLLPLGSSGLYYTRTGHLGTPSDLKHLIRIVQCNGYVTSQRPTMSNIGRHVVVTQRKVSGFPSSIRVISMDRLHDLSQEDQETAWDTVVLDHLQPTQLSEYAAFPDDRHLSGSIASSWVLLDRMFSRRKTTIVWTGLPVCERSLLDYMYLLRITYRKERFIRARYIRDCMALCRVAETMLVTGIVSM